MRALYNNRLMESGVTLTAASENVNYPASNLQDRRLSRVWKPTAGASQWVKLAGTDLVADCVALAGHSIPAGAMVTIEGNDSDSWGSPAFSEQIAPRVLLDDDCSSLTGWTDGDAGDGESTQVTYDGRSCFKLDSGSAGSGNYAYRNRDAGSFGDYTTIEVTVNHAALGTRSNGDYLFLGLINGSTYAIIALASDGCFVQNGAGSYIEVGTDIVRTVTWQTWRLIINWLSQTMDVYLDGVLQAAGMDCSVASSVANGAIRLLQYGNTTANRITYVDSIRVTDGAYSPSAGDLPTAWQNNTIYTHFFDRAMYDYWRVTIDADAVFSLGGLYLGDHLVMPYQDLGGSISDIDTSIMQVSRSGQVYGSEQYRYRTGKFSIPEIIHTQRADMRSLWESVGRTKPFYWQRWATRPDLEAPMYCVLDQDEIKWKGSGNDPNKFETDIILREVF